MKSKDGGPKCDAAILGSLSSIHKSVDCGSRRPFACCTRHGGIANANKMISRVKMGFLVFVKDCLCSLGWAYVLQDQFLSEPCRTGGLV